MVAGLPEWALGACICLFGSTLTALGLVVQKLSHEKRGREQHREGTAADGDEKDMSRRSYFLEPWWLLGFAIFISAQIINMVSMAMTPQVVLSCLGSWTLVCNTVFAYFLLGEKICLGQAIAVVCLVTSTVAVLANAPRPRPGEDDRDRDIRVLESRFLSPDFELLTVCLLGLASGIYALALGVPLVCQRRRPVANSNADDNHDDVELLGEQSPRTALVPLAWALMAAVAAGYTALLFKCISELIAGAAVGHTHPFWQCWETYVLVAAAFSCAPSELHCLNLALQNGEAISVVPMYLSMGMLAQLTTGAVFFQEFKDFKSMTDVAKFAASVAFTLCSVVGMAKARATSTATPAQPSSAPSTVKSESRLDETLLPALDLAGLGGTSFNAARSSNVTMAGVAGAIESIDKWKKLNSTRKQALSMYMSSLSGSLPGTPHSSGKLAHRAASAPV